jgi:uncharacterized protein (TIGR03118 family)
MMCRNTVSQRLSTISFGLALILSAVLPAAAQYKVVPLVSNQPGLARNQDPALVNAWGMAFAPNGPFWISDEGTGLSTLYTGTGVKQSLVVAIPSASGQVTGSPTGIVFNSTTDFIVTQNGLSGVATFLFDTLDGTISGWSPNVNATSAVIAAAKPGAVYTGLALGQAHGDNFLFAADNANNRVDVYDKAFNLVSSFTDAGLPQGSNPYNVQNIGGDLYVTFTTANGGGVVDIFDTDGRLKQTFAKGAPLKSPWGLAKSPSNFGRASNAILVGNLGDGRINAYDAGNGRFLGQLTNTSGKVISIDELWGLSFGGGTPSNGRTNQLFFTAGPNEYADGLFGVITQ